MSNGFSFSGKHRSLLAVDEALLRQLETPTKETKSDESDPLPVEFERVPYQCFEDNKALQDLILAAGGGSIKHGLRAISLEIRTMGEMTIRSIKLADVPQVYFPYLASVFNPVLSTTGKTCFFRPGYFSMNVNAMRRILLGRDKQATMDLVAQGYNSARIKWPHDAHVIMAKEGYRHRITLAIKGIVTDVYPQVPQAQATPGIDID